MLARAVAAQCGTTFFNISASSIVSKYRGDSEKLVRVLFDLARHHAPSTIFIDEIDSIMSQRGGGGGGAEHEGSRRMKTEVLIQMDGLAKTEGLVFVLAASNLPWELDMALLRRLEKRVLVPLPDAAARKNMLHKWLQGRAAPDVALDAYADDGATAGYSGSDLHLLCKEAAMRPVRRLVVQLEDMESKNGGAAVPDDRVDDLLDEHRITDADFKAALQCTNPSAKLFADKYRDWNANFGSS
jgi:katanin p60 ATPase-containing subunit A1